MPGDGSSDGSNYSYVHIAISGIHPILVTLPYGQTGELSPGVDQQVAVSWPFRSGES